MGSFTATYTGSTGQPRTVTVTASDLHDAERSCAVGASAPPIFKR